LPIAGASARGAAIGALIGLSLGVEEEFLVPRLSRRLDFFRLNLARGSAYAAAVLLALVVVNGLRVTPESGGGFLQGALLYLEDDSLRRDVLISLALSALITSMLQVRRLHNPGEIRGLLFGKYYYPKEESRVFLMADLVGSTAHAERLGPLLYSGLIRDLFTDVSEAILAWRGEVYQYAGDEVIISWPTERGACGSEATSCFFEMISSLGERASDYRDRYDAVPELRGAVHGGRVVTTWVGEAKRELAFHGDALNATARILGVCKARQAQLVISGDLLDGFSLPAGFTATSQGEVELRGKQEHVRLSAIRRDDDAEIPL
jgi:adenylate cyclase